MTDYKTDNAQALRDWWQSPLGQHVLCHERALFKTVTSHFYGYYQLQMGNEQCLLPPLAKKSIQTIMATDADVEGQYTALPFKCFSFDTLLLTHVLEFSDDPHQVLREAERVLVADGTLILCHFNPWSFWGIKRLFSLQDRPPWQGSFFSHTRIKDWLALLNFEVTSTERLLFAPPVQSPKWLQKLGFLDRWGTRLWPLCSGVTVTIATKRTIPLTPITRDRQQKRLFPRQLAPNSVSREKSNE